MKTNKRSGRWVLALLLVAVVLTGTLVVSPVYAQTEEDVFATAEWKMGTYANSAATSRRHAIIPCEVGQRFCFSFDSGWRLDLAFMSADGTVASRSIYVSSAIVWTVQTIDGITPAYLVVTARNSSNTVISDEEWATFPLTCYRKAAVATDESLADLFVTEEREGDCYTFSCYENDTFSFDFADSDYSLRVAYLDGETVLAEQDITADKSIVIGQTDGKVPSSVRVTVAPTAGGAMTESLWEAFDVCCRRESDHITVATMNYGHWNRGSGSGVADDVAADKLAAWNSLMNSALPDILCGQEWYESFNKGGTISADESIFAPVFPYLYSSSVNNGKNTASKYEFSEYSMECYVDNTKRDYTVGYVTVNGNKICVINTHNSTGTTEEAIATRKGEFEQLIALMNQEEYVILCGDFNVESEAEWKPFTDAGYRMANGGAFGSFATCPPSDCIDNVIVSPNIQIKSVEMIEDTVSDHNMLIAELKLVGADEMGDAISMYGVQASNDTNRARILTGVQSLMYNAVGFSVERWNGSNNTWTHLDDYEVTEVYTAVSAAGEQITATQAGYRYLTALVVEDIDSSGVVRISPYVVKNGGRIYGSSAVYSLQACYKTADGVYSDYESLRGSVLTVKPETNSVVIQPDLALPDFEGYTMLDIPDTFAGGSYESVLGYRNGGYLYEYRNTYYNQIVAADRAFRFGGQASFGSDDSTPSGLRGTSGVKYRQPLTGEKVLAFENISGEVTSDGPSSSFNGYIRFSHMLPDDACSEENVGKTFKVAFYVYVDNLRKWSEGEDGVYAHSAYDGQTMTVWVNLYNEGVTEGTAVCGTKKTVTLTRGKWNLVEYEFTVTEELAAAVLTKPYSSSDSTPTKCPIRLAMSLGTASAFAGDFYIDNIMAGQK